MGAQQRARRRLSSRKNGVLRRPAAERDAAAAGSRFFRSRRARLCGRVFFNSSACGWGAFGNVSPWLASAIGASVGLATFAAFEAWLLLSHHIQPQVSLISLGIVTAAGLSGVRGRQALVDASNAIDAAPAEAYDYDVFVSYAHDESAWVAEHVLGPLHAVTLPNGRKLKVFFDTSTIRAGSSWQAALSLAIDGSRFVIPVYSQRYFEQPYCRFEVMRAHRKWVLAGADSRCVLPSCAAIPRFPRRSTTFKRSASTIARISSSGTLPRSSYVYRAEPVQIRRKREGPCREAMRRRALLHDATSRRSQCPAHEATAASAARLYVVLHILVDGIFVESAAGFALRVEGSLSNERYGAEVCHSEAALYRSTSSSRPVGSAR